MSAPKKSASLDSIEDGVGWRVRRMASLMEQPFTKFVSGPFRLSASEWIILLALARKADQSPQELSAGTGVHPMTVSRALKRLETEGRVLRLPDPDDRRKLRIRIAENGLALYRTLAPAAARWQAEWSRALSTEERQQLADMLDRAAVHFEKALARFELDLESRTSDVASETARSRRTRA